jgi:hypothetical protein
MKHNRIVEPGTPNQTPLQVEAGEHIRALTELGTAMQKNGMPTAAATARNAAKFIRLLMRQHDPT